MHDTLTDLRLTMLTCVAEDGWWLAAHLRRYLPAPGLSPVDIWGWQLSAATTASLRRTAADTQRKIADLCFIYVDIHGLFVRMDCQTSSMADPTVGITDIQDPGDSDSNIAGIVYWLRGLAPPARPVSRLPGGPGSPQTAREGLLQSVPLQALTWWHAVNKAMEETRSIWCQTCHRGL